MARWALCLLVVAPGLGFAQYQKLSFDIPMRDGVKLRTTVYVPTDKAGPFPVLLERTPYSAGPYADDAQRRGHRGSGKMAEAGYIFAYQDVRGRYMSEGSFVNVRPQIFAPTGPMDIDESTDTFDTVDWITKNVPKNNGRVGLWGISYPGFYAAVGAINTHPALRAVSPQAPVSEWFIGDDFHHNGAFFQQDAFAFLGFFDGRRPGNGPSATYERVYDSSTGDDAYKFFLDKPLGVITRDIVKGNSPFWMDLMREGTYSEFWQARSLPRNMRNVKCGVLTVGGWYDAEDLWGALNIYKHTERQNPGIWNGLVMGPWYHGSWASSGWDHIHDMPLGADVSQWYQDEVEFPFFEAFLRGNGRPKLPEATVFVTGSNEWRKLDQWPPKGLSPLRFYPVRKGVLSKTTGVSLNRMSYTSDPANPVPYQAGLLTRRSRSYMLDDQRFASERSDVLTFETPALTEDVTVAGPIRADLFFQVDGTDCDLVVKVIDVYPNGAKGWMDRDLGGYQRLLRGEVFRTKFRNSFINPMPLVPNSTERLNYELPDVFHTFKKGHKIMIQVQSSWFPLVDRNPHQFMDIYRALPEDFRAAEVTLLSGPETPSSVTFGQLL